MVTGGTARGKSSEVGRNSVADVPRLRSTSPKFLLDRDPRLVKRLRGSMGREERRASRPRSFSFNFRDRLAGWSNDSAGRDVDSYRNGKSVDVPYIGVRDGLIGAPYIGVPVELVPASVSFVASNKRSEKKYGLTTLRGYRQQWAVTVEMRRGCESPNVGI